MSFKVGKYFAEVKEGKGVYEVLLKKDGKVIGRTIAKEFFEAIGLLDLFMELAEL